MEGRKRKRRGGWRGVGGGGGWRGRVGDAGGGGRGF